MQSMDETVLKNIKRQNIKLSTFKELQRQYIKRDIPTFSEFILGLPGESYQTFTRGITELIENGQHSKIEIYYCDVMPNAEMGDPAYQKKFGIKFVTIPLFQPHSSPVETEWDIVENQFIIHETSAMPTADWKRAGRFAWAIQFLHMLKVGQYVALYFRNRHDVSFLEFYESFLEFAAGRRDGFIREELATVDRTHDNVVAGLGFDQYVREFSPITWPMEEASFLRLSLNRDRFYAEFREFVFFLAEKLVLTVNPREIDDLLRYQREAVVHFDDAGDKTLDLDFNFPEYLYGCTVAVKSTELHAGTFRYLLRNTVNLQGNKKRFAEEILWGGRKGGRFMYVAEPVATA
jgi:putative methyltransferase